MRLKTRLVLATSVFTVLLTAALCCVFFTQLLQGRMSQAQAANVVLAHQLLLSMRGALVDGAASGAAASDEAGFERFVTDTLQKDTALRQTMDAIVSYSLTVQDVSVTAANGQVLVSTDPAQLGQRPPARRTFSTLLNASLPQQWAIVFGRPEVLDFALPLERNGGQFLYAHIGVRSSLLRTVLLPWLREAGAIVALALLCALGAAVLLSSLALRPIERISRQLEAVSRREAAAEAVRTDEGDAEARVSSTIAEIDRRIQRSEQQATNLSQMLGTLKDGVMLVQADGTIAMMSDSVRHFLPEVVAVGSPVSLLFAPETGMAELLDDALRTRQSVRGVVVELSDDRQIELSLDFAAPNAKGMAPAGAMLTLHDAAAREELEREIEVSRRMASIGRLTAGVGHEVKNPIHAMVLHLELLRGKLGTEEADDAGRHVDVLATEMTRLDRVVQVLADFTRPMEPTLRDLPIRGVVDSVLQLVSVDAALRDIDVMIRDASEGARARIDREMLHQSLLNIVLNAMDAMDRNGRLTVTLTRERGTVLIGVRDTGSGIAPEALERIFHLYFTTKPEGSGIGLAMTWRMVQMMGGTITVHSVDDPEAVDRGTLFTVSLPISARLSPSPVHESRLEVGA